MAIGMNEWYVIGGIVILLFGAGALGKWVKAIAQAKRELKMEEARPKV